MSNYKEENRRMAKWLEDNEKSRAPEAQNDSRMGINRRRQRNRKKRAGV